MNPPSVSFLVRGALRRFRARPRVSAGTLPHSITGSPCLSGGPRNCFATAVSAADIQFGQPVYETHPHLLQPGELTIGITAEEYHHRRAALASELPSGGVALLPAATLKYRSGAVFHAYRQESNFLYLTGFNEPESVALIQKSGQNWGDYIFHLFVQAKDPIAEQWAGPRSGLQAALDVFNADESYDVQRAESSLLKILQHSTAIYVDKPLQEPGSPGAKISNLLDSSSSDIPTVRPLSPVVNRLRAIKRRPEVANMRKAGQISGRVITKAMSQGWTREKDLQAFLDYNFTARGCDGPAYIPVVAGGENACIIHYVHNNNVLRSGQLALVDAGGEYGTYITDISRTWPVSGKFTPAQRDLYQAVLTVQRQGVALCRESTSVSLDDIHKRTVEGLREQLSLLGVETTHHTINQLFPHHVGHYIGLDVHDVPGYSRGETLRSGHCVTIEPGIYFPDDSRWPKHFRGMGIRIEDSVCVDKDSPYVLTTEAVKEVDDIEALRS